MGILERFDKQPDEVQDYDIDFGEYLTSMNDFAQSYVCVADAGITIASSLLLTGGVVKVFLSGGTDGNNYKVTTTLTTLGGRVKQAEIIIKVKEI
jgi:hypothetical protein